MKWVYLCEKCVIVKYFSSLHCKEMSISCESANVMIYKMG